ncbi:MAG: sigma-54-dependent Fis family transcriptional regulator [Acidobacteria bacterium]|nr:sigma-54-dependent Fis family transcriptional regulator [Acidobacteriota bacterium]
MGKILVLDDEASMRTVLQIGLARAGHSVDVEAVPGNAVRRIREGRYDLVISDLKMPALSGIEVLKQSRSDAPETQFIFITAFASSETAIEALRLGAYDYITKPFDVEELKVLASRAIQSREARQKALRLDWQSGHTPHLIGVSPQMLKIYKLIGSLSGTTSTILITGESGTGKELVARAIHEASSRKEMPFVSINCGAFPESLLESELFGYMKGAFTGAVRDKEGLFEHAAGGTLFLDEVGEMSPAMQVKLLRVLQERKIRPLGGVDEVPVSVRLIGATNRDLQEQLRQGQFREDLYYRIAVIPIHIPPLRERPEDLDLLLDHFLARYTAVLDKQISGIEPEALRVLRSHHWPGNVRELENVMERAVALEPTDKIRLDRLPDFSKVRGLVGSLATPIFSTEGIDLEECLRETETQLVLAALRHCCWNQARAARLLNLSYRSLRHRVETLGIQKPGGEPEEAIA